MSPNRWSSRLPGGGIPWDRGPGKGYTSSCRKSGEKDQDARAHTHTHTHSRERAARVPSDHKAECFSHSTADIEVGEFSPVGGCPPHEGC